MARVGAIAYLIVLTGTLLAPRPFDALGELAPSAQWLVGPGYWIHGLLYLGLGIVMLRAFGRGAPVRVAAIVFLVSLHAVAAEAAQAFIPGREVDRLDLLANLVGGLLGWAAWRCGGRRRASRPSQCRRTPL
jgi:glycopeptide antibiotics resistance protein